MSEITPKLQSKNQEALILCNDMQRSSFNLQSVNPLVSAAMPLLVLISKLKDINQPYHLGIHELRHEIIREIQAFEIQAKSLQCSPRLILAARYCLCTAIDETILLSSWGHDSQWSQQSLLSLLHKETWGGERFFIILDRISEQACENLPLLELIYFILCLGFEGKYYNQDKNIRDEIRHRLFRIIMVYREQPHRNLSPSVNAIASCSLNKRNKASSKKIFFTALIFTLLVCLSCNVLTEIYSIKIMNTIQILSINTPKFLPKNNYSNVDKKYIHKNTIIKI